MDHETHRRLRIAAERKARGHRPDLDAAVHRGARLFRRRLLLVQAGATTVVVLVAVLAVSVTAVARETPAPPPQPSPTVTPSPTPPPPTETPTPTEESTPTPTVTEPQLEVIALEPDTAVLEVEETATFIALGTFSDGSVEDVSKVVAWTTSDPKVADLEAPGVVRARSPGGADVTATLGELEASAAVRVLQGEVTLLSLTVDPGEVSMGTDDAQQLTAVGTFSDGTVEDVTDRVTWSTGDPDIVIVSPDGLAEAGSSGKTQISATLEDLTELVTVVVTVQ